MKNVHLKLLGMLVLLAWSSCEKVEIPDSTYTGIPFGISGKAGAEDLKLGIDQAGIKLHTGVEFVEDALWEFSGRLESSGPDGRFLSIQLRNRIEGRDSIIHWEPYILDSLTYMQEGGITRVLHELRVSAQNSENLVIQAIQAGDQRREGTQNQTTFLMPNGSNVPVCIEYGNGLLSGKFCSEISPQPKIQVSFPNWIVLSNNQQSARLAARLSNAAMIETYNWGNGDQNTEHLSASTPGIYEIKMTDIHQRKFSHAKKLLYDNANGFSTYGNSFQFKSEWLSTVPVIDKKQLRSVNITYRDRSGIIYRSNRGPQGLNRFSIEEIKEYERDGRGRPTLAIKVRFTARLFSQSDSILLENCHGWFAVGLP